MPAEEQDEAEAIDEDMLDLAVDPPTADYPPERPLGVEDDRDLAAAGDVPIDSVAERAMREEPDFDLPQSRAATSAEVPAEQAALHVEEP